MPPPPALRPPADPDVYPSWLTWLDTHHLTPVAYKTLTDEPLPSHVRLYLAAAYAQNRAAWLQRRHETLALLDILAREPAIPVVLLKGMALAASLYPDPALRPMNDVDLLVPSALLSQAAARLRAEGYTYEGHNHMQRLGAAQLYQVSFTSQRTEPHLLIELHTTFPHLSPAGEEAAIAWFWSHTDVIEFERHSVRLSSTPPLISSTWLPTPPNITAPPGWF